MAYSWLMVISCRVWSCSFYRSVGQKEKWVDLLYTTKSTELRDLSMFFIVIYTAILYVHDIIEGVAEGQRFLLDLNFSLGVTITHILMTVLLFSPPIHHVVLSVDRDFPCKKDYNCWWFLLSADNRKCEEKHHLWQKKSKTLICTSCRDANTTSSFQSGWRSSSYSSRSCMLKGKRGWWRGEKMTLINPLLRPPTCLVQHGCGSVINTH